jgi:hypothetical protein
MRASFSPNSKTSTSTVSVLSVPNFKSENSPYIGMLACAISDISQRPEITSAPPRILASAINDTITPNAPTIAALTPMDVAQSFSPNAPGRGGNGPGSRSA